MHQHAYVAYMHQHAYVAYMHQHPYVAYMHQHAYVAYMHQHPYVPSAQARNTHTSTRHVYALSLRVGTWCGVACAGAGASGGVPGRAAGRGGGAVGGATNNDNEGEFLCEKCDRRFKSHHALSVHYATSAAHKVPHASVYAVAAVSSRCGLLSEQQGGELL